MSEKLTPWFPASVYPVRIGVYEVESDNSSVGYSLWDGSYFRSICATVDKAESTLAHIGDYHGLIWRGLAKKP